jgi:nucleotide-binding universal stress UspA family protein
MQDSPSIYDVNAPRLNARGYFPIIIGPGSKAPHRYIPSRGCFELQMGWSKRAEPIMTPQPGAGIGVRTGNGLVAFDYDDDEAALSISPHFPESPVNKTGQTAWTGFYRADFPVPSENVFDGNGNKVLEILSDGRQTVVPPSIHPDTQEPYRYVNGRSLQDVSPSELPPLPRDYRERILALGYTLGKATKAEEPTSAAGTGGSETEFAEINATALANPAAWVPALGLYKCKRGVGRGGPYTAVATWRASTTGKALEDREPNLKIHRSGIKDFGDGRAYSALDLVMAKRGGSLFEAFCWLEEHLLSEPKVEVDWDALGKNDDAPPISPGDEESPKEESPKEQAKRADDPNDLVGKEWEDGDPIPAPLPMLIPYFIPMEPYLGYLWGQSQTYKTFLLNTMAVAVASGTRFAGYQVTTRGLVYQVELEGSRSQVRIQAAKQCAGISGKLPIVHVTQTPPSLIGAGKRVTHEWKKWARQLVQKAKAAAERHGVPLVLITIDPQNHFAGFTDEQSSAEGNVVCNALIAMAKEAGCPVLVADHLGKNAAAGGRGTSVKHQSPWFILDAGESAEELGEERILIIRKMKDGEDGVGISFHMERYDAVIDQQARNEDGTMRVERVEHSTLVVVFEGEVRPVNTIKSGETNALTDKEMIVLNQINAMLNHEGQELPAECGQSAGLRGIRIERLRIRVTRNPSFAGKGRGAALFQRTLDSLMAKKKIDAMDDWVWVPLMD